MVDAVEVVKYLLQEYSDKTLLYLMMIGAKHVKETADAQPRYKSLSPLEPANGYVSGVWRKSSIISRGCWGDD